MELSNKNVFVTGSTRGIGLAIAHKFASLGANVVLNGRSAISDELLAQFANYGVKVIGVSGDVSDNADAKRMVEEAGANVVLNGRSAISDELLAQFANYGVKVIGVSGDVSDNADAKRMVEEAIEALGSVDILINNAGITKDGMALRMSEEDFESVLKINLTGTFNMTQAVLKPMTKARAGAIINLSSVVGLIMQESLRMEWPCGCLKKILKVS